MWIQKAVIIALAIVNSVYPSNILFSDSTYSQRANSKITSKVNIGIFLIYVDKIDVKAQTFYSEFYLNMDWKQGERSGENFEFTNAIQINKSFYFEWVANSSYHISCKIKGTFRSSMDVSKFPFDKHLLAIRIADNVYNVDSLSYATSNFYTGISSELSSPEWDIYPEKSIIDTVKDFGIKFAEYKYSFLVDRKSTSFTIKILIPILIVISVSLLNLFIPKHELETCIGLGITSLLSIIALHFSISGQLPDVNYPTKIDLLMIGSYLLIFLSMVEIIIAYNLSQNHRTEKLNSIEHKAKYILPISFCLFIIILMVV